MDRRTILKLGVFAPFARAAARSCDVLVYGATPAGIVAAIAAAQEGLHVLLLEASHHLGGMVSGGLGGTDKGKVEVIGGLSREFFERVGKHYAEPVSWWFEPHIAMKVARDWLREAGIEPRFGEAVELVRKSGSVIEAIRTVSGGVLAAKTFIDASYEGDLMAKAGISYIVGREGQRQYSEPLAGRLEFSTWDQFWTIVNPYDERGNLLPLIHTGDSGKPGAADRKVQSYNFRICFSKDRANQVEFPRPPGYEAARFRLLGRYLENPGKALTLHNVIMLARLPNGKLDVNNNGPVSTDYLGANWDYPEASDARRAEIWESHRRYNQGLLYFLAKDPSVPNHLRDEMNTWGLAKDEFVETDHWPPQLYVREARRLIGEYVMTQADVQESISKPDAVGMGSYNIDSHHFQRIASPVRAVINEGFINDRRVTPYQLPYRCLTPKAAECSNLLVPVCCSASHVAYSSIRLEPQYMILGHAAGVAAAMSVRGRTSVQKVEVAELKKKLQKQRQVLSLTT